MRYLDKSNGYKTRKACVKKLNDLLGDTGPATVGIVVANSDGTYSPAVLLSQDNIHCAAALAGQGVYVMGPTA